jgi:kinetochore protein Mis13/DSN1
MKRQLAKRNTMHLRSILSPIKDEQTRIQLDAIEEEPFVFQKKRQTIATIEKQHTHVLKDVNQKDEKMVINIEQQKKEALILDEIVPLKEEASTILTTVSQQRRKSVFGRASSRRSSVALFRGKRASSVAGGALVLPHPAVPSSDFHSLISTEVPGPIRMRQLLIWCTQDLLRSENSTKNGDPSVEHGSMKNKVSGSEDTQKSHSLPKNHSQTSTQITAKQKLLQALLEGLQNKEIETSWYQRPVDLTEKQLIQPIGRHKLPNPRNEDIRAALAVYENFYAQLEAKKFAWEALLTENECDADPVTETEALSVLDPDAHAFLQVTAQEADKSMTLLKAQSSWLASFPFKADLVATAFSTASHFEKHAKFYCENLFKSIYYKFMVQKERSLPSALAAQHIDTLHLLRALSRVN